MGHPLPHPPHRWKGASARTCARSERRPGSGTVSVMRVSRLLAVVLFGGIFGCSGLSVVGGGDDVPAVNDLGADAGFDVPAVLDVPVDAFDAPSMDVATDRGADVEAAFRCVSDGDCVGNAAGPACDVATGRCVPCTATDDVCPDGRYCDDASHSCVPGCRDDRACAGASTADGGTGPSRRCDRSSRTCVDCLASADCPAGTLCVGNLCVAGCTADSRCPTGQTCCSGACVDTLSNTAHCSACDARCAVPNGSPVCLNGICTVGMCAAPFGNCDGDNGNGCETNTLTSTAHCGGCGMACTVPAHATSTCVGGTCGFACVAGFADCDGNPANGCEVDTQGDIAHCGSCTSACNPPNAAPACTAGVCAVATCVTGFGDCDGNASNGCETDVRRSTASCGGCGRACPDRDNAFPGCLAGACVWSCVTGFQDCDGNAANGCESDLRTDAANCGTCGRACAPANGSGACMAGRCAVTACNTGFADCNGDPADGCEVNLQTDVGHCGACATACTAAGGVPACVAGVCGLSSCSAGRGDCDRMSSNGCETDLTTSPTNCGACGTACVLPNATTGCAAGRCTVASCNAGFGDCDGDPSNGCETNLNTTAASCGACGSRCALGNATAACSAGRCAVAACNTGFADCDGVAANGCETNVLVTVGSCGTCGNACSAANGTPGCTGGASTVAGCNAGFANSDGVASNGSEVNTTNDARNCAACGRACSLPNTAVAGCGGSACTVVTCAAGYADCNGGAGDGCEVNTTNDANNCGGCGTRCPSGVCREGSCQSFGGGYETSDPGCASCNNGNAENSGSCGCPSGFGTVVGWRVINDCRGRGTQAGANVTFCGASAAGEYGGAYQQDDGVPGGLGCRAANPYTGGCSCPGGYTAIGFRALADSSRGIIGSNPAICVRSSGARPAFGGAYQQDDAVPGGVACRAANPVTGGCSCPAGYGANALRLEVDSSAGFIGSQVFVCER